MQEKIGRVYERFTDLANFKKANKLPKVKYMERGKWQIQGRTQAYQLANGLAAML